MSTPVIDAMGRLGVWRAAHGRARTPNPISQEHRAHDALANSTQLPPRPVLKFSLEFSLEFCWEAWSPASDGSCEPEDPPAECDRRSPDLSYERHFVAPPPLYLVPPHMDLGLFRKSNRPSRRGGLDLGLFEKSNRPSLREGLDFGLFRKSNRPSKCVETP